MLTEDFAAKMEASGEKEGIIINRVIVIMGSPRKNSNTHILAGEARRGLADVGVQSEEFIINDLNIRGCQGCYCCKRAKDGCALNDDMQKIYKAIDGSCGLIIATPVYFAGITAQTKIWLDRMFAYIDLGIGSVLPKGKRASFIFTQSQPNPSLFRKPLETFVDTIGFVGYDIRDTMLVCDLDADYKPPVTQREGYMAQAYRLGRRLMQ